VDHVANVSRSISTPSRVILQLSQECSPKKASASAVRRSEEARKIRPALRPRVSTNPSSG